MRCSPRFSPLVFALFLGLAAGCAQGTEELDDDNQLTGPDAHEGAIDARPLPIDAAPLPIDASPLPIDAAAPIDGPPGSGGTCTTNSQCPAADDCCFALPPGGQGICTPGTEDPIFQCLPA